MKTFARRSLVEFGTTDHDLQTYVADGRIERIRHGHYAASQEWRDAYVEERQRALALAATDAATDPPVTCRATAAAVHGLPLFRIRDDGVAHLLTGDDGSGTRSATVVRHRDRWDGENVEIDGVRATTLVRTVFDVARTASLAAGLACADAAIHRVAATDRFHVVDEEKSEQFRDELRALIGGYPGARGITNARFIADVMDPRADSPGESVSRLYLIQSGIDDVGLQVPVTGATGRHYFVDFEIQGVLGEFDGAAKYQNPDMREGRTPEQIVIDEKRREDDIRGVSGQRLIRWTFEELSSRSAFLAFLGRSGIHPRQRTRFIRTDMK